jgi:hypothetical protein
MLIQTSDGPIRFAGKTFSPGKSSDSLISSDARDVRDFFAGNCLTGGFSLQFAINRESREVVELFKKGRIAQRDVKELIARGFTEWSFSWAWAPGHFLFPDGTIVTVAEKIDLSPKETTVDALRFGVALGTI